MTGPKVQFKITSKNKFTCPIDDWSPATDTWFKPRYSAGQIIFVEDDW